MEVEYDRRRLYEALAGYGTGVHARLVLASESLATMAESDSTLPDEEAREAAYALSCMIAGCAADVERAAEALPPGNRPDGGDGAGRLAQMADELEQGAGGLLSLLQAYLEMEAWYMREYGAPDAYRDSAEYLAARCSEEHERLHGLFAAACGGDRP